MKKLVLLFLLLSNLVHARQYIQCEDTDSWDHAVINLNNENSTLFLTNRVDAPDEDRIKVLKKLYFEQNTSDHAIFVTKEGEVEDIVKIPLNILNKYSQNFKIILGHKNIESDYSYEREMICFSAIYE